MLTSAQIEQLFRVFDGPGTRSDGSIKVNELDHAVRDFLVKYPQGRWIFKDKNGRYYPREQGTGWIGEPKRAKFINLDWRNLPDYILWWVIKGMLRDGHSVGYSITRSPRWNMLNMFFADQYSYKRNAEHWLDEQMQVLNRLASAGYIWFLCAGQVWEITNREMEMAA